MAKPAARAVVSDDGSAIRSIAYSGNGVAVPVELLPTRAIAVAIDLLQAARPKLQSAAAPRPKLQSAAAARPKKRRGGDPRAAKREQRDEALREAQIADLETRKRAVAGELIRRGVSEVEGALFRTIVVGETMVSTLHRGGVEQAMGEAWVARFLKWSKRSAFVKTTARTGSVRLAA